MDRHEIDTLLAAQRNFFAGGAVMDIGFRLRALRRLRAEVQSHEAEINAALEQDLGKCRFESYMCETGMVCAEISYLLKHLKSFASEKRVPTPLAQFAGRSYRKPVPYGTVLIMSPWNYPLLLSLSPLADALAAGNTAVVKPSAYAPHTGKVIERLIARCFAPSYVTVVTGGREENGWLLEEPFDYIFFTGSQRVGKEVMRKAAGHLTPVTLELGGKSPCIVDRTAKIPLAAKRIVFGKFLNCGQTCVAPDYVLCDETIHDRLAEEIVRQIRRQYGDDPLQNAHYGKIINQKHFDRISALIDPDKIIFGGTMDADACRIAPVVLDNVQWDDAVMGEEIFGPVLPILTFQSLAEALREINARPHPLALYLFSQNRKVVEYVTGHCQFGGGCINDTIIHLATSHLSFGGVGASGMGAYHGKAGFDTFSHQKSIVDKKTWIDLPVRYQPAGRWNEWLLRRFLR